MTSEASRVEGRATVRVIAAETGVSIATVSRVLNNHVSVAPRTRELVLQAVARRSAARAVPRAATAAVYVRCPYVLTDYFGTIVSSVAATLARRGVNLVLNAGEELQSERVLSALPDRDDIGAAILILPPESASELVALRRRGFPFVVLDPRTALPRDVPAVSAAHFSGARAVTTHLVELGHRRIGVIGGPQDWLASDGRLAGHRAVMSAVGLLPDRAILRDVPATVEAGYAAACELLDLPDRPTALVGFNDKVAVGVLRAAHERGLRVPEDLSVTGFDDIELSQATQPQLTTVRQPLTEMGRMAVTMLMRILEHDDVDSLQVELGTELVVRGSTGPVPA
jgi:LacI family transcriptional regulator